MEIPWIGLGVYRSPPGSVTRKAILSALKAGYRHIDTAKIYGNEIDVGNAIRESNIPRDDIFVTTKLWNSDHGFDSAIKACNESLRKLNFDYIDLYLVHWPVEKKRLDTWKAMENLFEEGKVRSIGISNYMKRHLTELIDNCRIKPTVNQIEISPYNYLYRKETIDFCQSNNIALEAYSPLTKARKLNDPKLIQVAERYSKTPAQVLIRYILQQKIIVIPKSINPTRIRENADVFDFTLSQDDMQFLTSFNENLITGWDPTNAP
ncbi:MAG: aldo/keto reductase [Promethearchaeota archaeon]